MDIRYNFVTNSETPRLSINVSCTEDYGPANASVQSQPLTEQPGQGKVEHLMVIIFSVVIFFLFEVFLFQPTSVRVLLIMPECKTCPGKLP